MKKRVFFVISLLFLLVSTSGLFAQCGNHGGGNSGGNHSEHNSGTTVNHENHKAGMQMFKVGGNCDMCKTRIEKAALGVKGVKSAEWDKETKMLHLDFKKEIDINDVYGAVAKAGHDTEQFKTADNIYNNLPECCKYRK